MPTISVNISLSLSLSLSDRICFTAPAVNRKRIAVSLDMNDLMAKMK